jgi:iron complex transport system substrate-binding protein
MKRRAATLILVIATIFFIPEASAADEYHRIVSLAPSITETLYAVGLGDAVAGVTRFCTWPPEARDKPEVGGLYDPNLEAIVALEPDLVLMLPAHEAIVPMLDGLGIEHLAIPNETVSEIIGTVRAIGEKCGREKEAESLADSLDRVLGAGTATDGEAPRALVVVDRQYGETPDEVYAAAAGTWYDELLSAAGLVNVLRESTPVYPMLTPESLVYLQPDIIIEVVPGARDRGLDPAAILSDWAALDMVDAARQGRVHILTGRYAAVPGPRFVLLLEDLRRLAEEAK